ncbi:hypothetical protein AHAS_Ahas03G0138700 [Arachis hypogaea]
MLHSKTKYFEINFHFVKNYVISKVIQVMHVFSSVQLANTFVKTLLSTSVLNLKDKLMVYCPINSSASSKAKESFEGGK